MNRIKNAFQNGKAFIGFLTAGDPNLKKSEDLILAMVRAGADLIEIGIPFSDPVAEGPVIQKANIRALNSGTTADHVFDLVGRIREKTEIPIVLLTYLNPVFTYGYDKFFARCQETGVDGIIIPDLPYEEREELIPFAKANGVDVISLIAPTSQQRILEIAREAEGYIYLVSSMGVTGMRNTIQTDLDSMVRTIRSVTDTPIAIGFGINTPEQAQKLSQIADGVIVGSAIVKIIEEHGVHAEEPIYEYVKKMKNAMDNKLL